MEMEKRKETRKEREREIVRIEYCTFRIPPESKPT
jgi:hypothetical protein